MHDHASSARPARDLLVALVIVGNLLLGLRGLGRDRIDFFAMKPFSDPLVRCEVEVFEEEGGSRVPLPFPSPIYRFVPSASFTNRLYQETLPLYAQALATAAGRSSPGAKVHITCHELNGGRTFTSRS